VEEPDAATVRVKQFGAIGFGEAHTP